MRRFPWVLLFLLILFALRSCAFDTVAVGEDGMRVRAGEWLGANHTGSAMLDFRIRSAGDTGANVLLSSYSYPCGEQSVTTSAFGMGDMGLTRAIDKSAIHDGSFEVHVESTDLYSDGASTKLVFTGEFIDSTHAEGTWEVFRHQIFPGDMVCPAAKGTWQGSPK